MREYTSIVIPTFNKAPLLRDILCDLNNQTDKEFEVVVVDDGSTDDTIDMLREVPVKYRLRVFETGLSDEFGMCKAYNIGIAHAFGALTLLLNDDVYLHPNCVKMHRIAHKKLRARHALIGPRFKCPPFAFGEEVECGDIKRRQFKKYTTARQIQGYPVYRVKMMVSSNLSMSTRRLRKIGGYNEIFKTYTGEIDRDFHRRVSSARMEVLYVWRAQAF